MRLANVHPVMVHWIEVPPLPKRGPDLKERRPQAPWTRPREPLRLPPASAACRSGPKLRYQRTRGGGRFRSGAESRRRGVTFFG